MTPGTRLAFVRMDHAWAQRHAPQLLNDETLTERERAVRFPGYASQRARDCATDSDWPQGASICADAPLSVSVCNKIATVEPWTASVGRAGLTAQPVASPFRPGLGSGSSSVANTAGAVERRGCAPVPASPSTDAA